VHEISLPGELAVYLLPQCVGVPGDLAPYLLVQGVKLLCQTLFPCLQLVLQITPCCLLGPQGQDPQQRSSQCSLLVRRKAGGV